MRSTAAQTRAATKKGAKAKARKGKSEAKSKAPVQKVIRRDDFLTVLLAAEKQKVCEAELRAAKMEHQNVIAQINAKYGIDITKFSINSDTGLLTPLEAEGSNGVKKEAEAEK